MTTEMVSLSQASKPNAACRDLVRILKSSNVHDYLGFDACTVIMMENEKPFARAHYKFLK